MDSVKGIRFNTARKLEEPLDQLLPSLKSKISPKDLWIDLKCRQLRLVNNPTVPPDNLELNHRIKVKTPTDLRFKELIEDKETDAKKEVYRSVKIEDILRGPFYFSRGSNKIKLNLPHGLKISFGYGSAVSIEDPSLKIFGYLTEKDKQLMEEAKKIDVHKYMISFTHEEKDLKDVFSHDSEAEILAKIEDSEGLNFVDSVYPKYKDKNVHLIAARGDMYEQLGPYETLKALKKIIKADPDAVAASRLFQSLSRINPNQEPPDCADVCDIGFLSELGYRRYLLGDELCYDGEKLGIAISLLDNTIKKYHDF
jgi:pyruvate kinase